MELKKTIHKGSEELSDHAQGLFKNVDFFRQAHANLSLNMKGRVGVVIGDVENIDSNKEVREEDSLMKIGEGKKRPHSTRFALVFGNMDSGVTFDGQIFVPNLEVPTGSAGQSNRMQ